MIEQTSEMHKRGRLLDVFATALKLGLTSFGGPVAHIGFFRNEYVTRKKWLDEQEYADIVALCQFLPGPASSQVGMAIGMKHAGWAGGVLAWLGFTLPSALALLVFALLVQSMDVSGVGWLHGLKLVAVAVVAQAVWGMAKSLTPDAKRATLAILSTVVVLLFPSPWTQIVVIVCAGVIGVVWLHSIRSEQSTVGVNLTSLTLQSKRNAFSAFALFIILLLGLPVVASFYPSMTTQVMASFYKVGSLVFGGGHVVLPLLQSEVVSNHWLTNDEFITGYSAAQAVPGPLFTFSSYIGAAMSTGWEGVGYSFLALIFIFLPSYLLVASSLPFWDIIRTKPLFHSALLGINAAVVGVLLAALYDPIWTTSIFTAVDFAFVLCTFGLLVLWKCPAWIVVLSAAVVGFIVFG